MESTMMPASHAMRRRAGTSAAETLVFSSMAMVSSGDMLPGGGTSDPTNRRLPAQAITRSQFRMFNEIGEAISLGTNDRRRMLALSEAEWAAWMAFGQDGPVPTQPNMSEMLRRLATATYRLSLAAEGHRLLS
jgi:hypothetical protein